MRPADACTLLADGLITYKPGWRLRAAPTDRFEDTIMVEVRYSAPNYDEDQAPVYAGPCLPNLGTNVPVEVADLDTPEDLDAAIFEQVIMRAERHEAREAWRRLKGARWIASLHPHTREGMARHGDPTGDRLFSLLVSQHAEDFAPSPA